MRITLCRTPGWSSPYGPGGALVSGPRWKRPETNVEIARLYAAGESVNAIARAVRVGNTRVRRVLGPAVRTRGAALLVAIDKRRRGGLSWGGPSGASNRSFKGTLAADAAWLTREYVERQRSARDIGSDLGLAQASVLRWLRVHGIRVRTSAAAEALRDKAGRRNPNYRHGRSMAILAQRLRASNRWWVRAVIACGRCQQCGSRDRLEAHHQVPFAQLLVAELLRHRLAASTQIEIDHAFRVLRRGTSLFLPNNGICLCAVCHKRTGVEWVRPPEGRCRA